MAESAASRTYEERHAALLDQLERPGNTPEEVSQIERKLKILDEQQKQ